jgi:imidazolonepropionase-like amidohydrolase
MVIIRDLCWEFNIRTHRKGIVMSTAQLFRYLFLVLLVTILLLPGEAQSQGTSNVKTVLTNCSVIDCTGSPVQENMTVVITGNEITSISKGAYQQSRQEDNVRMIDLEGAYVLPGFWNMHIHLTDIFPQNHALDNETVNAKVIRAGLKAMNGLRSGFTSIRSAGAEEYIDVAWRDAFAQGFFMGPRIFACGEPVSPTAGHRGDIADGADGVAEIRKAVRIRIQHGVNMIKIMNVEMLRDELEAALETAHSFGLHVLTHTREPQAYTAVQAGVDSVEHGYGLMDKTIKLMAKKGTFYCPTIVCNLSDEYIKERENRLTELGYSKDEQIVRIRRAIAYADERSPEHALHQRQALVKAAQAGVKLLIGSDSMPIEFGVLEMEQFVLSGISEMETLIAATRNCAEIMGLLDKLGTVEEGKLADLVVVTENPLDNISNIRKLKMVFKDGVSVDLNQPQGTARFWDFYSSLGSGKGGYLGAAESDAGFIKRGKTEPPE